MNFFWLFPHKTSEVAEKRESSFNPVESSNKTDNGFRKAGLGLGVGNYEWDYIGPTELRPRFSRDNKVV